MSPRDILFYVYAVLSITCAVGIVRATRLVHAVVWLFATMVSLAGVYLVLGSELIAGVQLFVYGGAVTVLALFALALTRPLPELISHLPSASPWIAGVGVAMLLTTLVAAAIDTKALSAEVKPAPGTAMVAADVFGRHVVLFEVAGLLLTIALVGAVIVARKDDGS